MMVMMMRLVTYDDEGEEGDDDADLDICSEVADCNDDDGDADDEDDVKEENDDD